MPDHVGRLADRGDQQAPPKTENEHSEVQQATATFPYLAPGSRQSGALLFSADPTDGRLEIRPAAYTLA